MNSQKNIVREKITLTPSQETALKAVSSGKNIFITGGAGTGKTLLEGEIVKAREAGGLPVAVCAPTGTAAANINGTTMHRLFGIRPGETIVNKADHLALGPCYSKVVDSAGMVIIDEISMVRMDLFDCAAKKILRAKRDIQLIVIGDPYQLPPVIDKKNGEYRVLKQFYGKDIGRAYAYSGNYWDKLHFKCVNLTEQKRQEDPDFVAALNSIRKGECTAIPYINDNCCGRNIPESIVTLTGKKKDASQINNSKLCSLKTKEHIFKAEISGRVFESEMRLDPVLKLKEGARVMMLINDQDGAYHNGSLGIVRNIYNGKVDVEIDTTHKVITAEPYTINVMDYGIDDDGMLVTRKRGSVTQYPLTLSYAMTIHKAQGSTLDCVYLHPDCWDPGQLYVALSRVRRVEDLYLATPIHDALIITDPAAKAFLASCEPYSA